MNDLRLLAVRECTKCNGSGKNSDKKACKKCHGAGKRHEEISIQDLMTQLREIKPK